mgnify:CR=1 FL=1
MKHFFEDTAALVAMLCMVVGIWLGFAICAVAYNPNAAEMQRVEQELEQARAQYIAWFNEDPIKE